MPKPDERNSRTAARKSGLIKTPAQQSAFAAQNLEDMVMYDVERVRNPCLQPPFVLYFIIAQCAMHIQSYLKFWQFCIDT